MDLLHAYGRRLAAALTAGALLVALAGCGGAAPSASAPSSAPASEPAAPASDLPLGEINVKPVEGLPEDFLRGVDISSLPAELESGVVYHDLDGGEVTDVIGFCKLLAEVGVTDVRVRVWNDPFDADGNGYGGGNCNVLTAAALAEGCKEAGLHMLVDFHLSDFWADPSKQMAPKAWAGYTVAQKADAVAAYITESLNAIELVGPGVVTMVQVGNETTSGLAGETGADAMCALYSAGCDAVKAFGESVGRTVKSVIHLTDPQKGTLTSWAKTLDEHGVAYDVLASSYYPYWHGSLAALADELTAVRTTYGKEVMVAETSYAYTLTDTDGNGNTVAEGSNDTGADLHWSFTVQGQAVYLRDLMEAVAGAGGLGVFYWEPAWITVGDVTGGATRADNETLWEQYGSGWASSYSAEYDPDDAGKWYGGSAVDNQALFDAAGQPLASLRVWQYVYTGCQNPDLPEEEWLEGSGGTPAGSGEAAAVEGNLLPAAMASFDDGSGYTIEGAAISAIPNTEGPYEGANDMHWWSESEVTTGSVTTAEPITLAPGVYIASVMTQGCEGDVVKLEILDGDGQVQIESEPVTLTGWNNWQQPTVEFGIESEMPVQLRISVEIQSGGWGTCDLLALTPAA